ncbi:MAG: hypothetical protein GXP63_04630 [DPANN group archaeon]|nr:hypothetical protein [DPANN group archaeon]
MEKKEETITTVVDALVSLVRNRKRISFDDAAKSLKIPVKTIESWATFLEEEGELSVEYKFTTPFLVNKSSLVKGMVEEESSLTDRLMTLSQLLEQADAHLKNSRFSAAEVVYGKILEAALRLFQELKKDRKDERPFEDQDIDFKLKELGDYISKAKDALAQNAMADTKTLYAQIREKTKLLHSKFQEMSGLVPVSPKKKFKALPKRNYDTITEVDVLLKEAYDNMRAGNFDTANRIYQRINRIYEQLPTEYHQKKNALKTDIVKLNRDLTVNLKENFRIRINDALKRVDELVHLINRSLSRADFETAEAIIKNMNRLYNRLPEGFLEERILIREKILKAHEQFIEMKKQSLKQKTASMEGEMKRLLSQLDKALKEKHHRMAETLYEQVNALFKRLPPGFMLEDDKLEDLLIDRYRNLLRLREATNKSDLKEKTRQIGDCIARSRGHLGKNLDLEAAIAAYNDAKKVYGALPAGFLEQTSALQEDILRLNEEILLKQREYHKTAFGEMANTIDALLEKIRKYLKADQVDLANELFMEIEDHFNRLPPGFLHEKTKIHKRIIEEYKNMMMKSDWSLLEHETKDVKKQYNDLIKLIIQIHVHLEREEFNLLEPNHAYVKKIFNELPHGLVMQNIRIRKEIDNLDAMVMLYRLMKEQEKLKGRRISAPKLHEARKLIDLLSRVSPQSFRLVRSARSLLFGETEDIHALSNMAAPSLLAPAPPPMDMERTRQAPLSHEAKMDALKEISKEHLQGDRYSIFQKLENFGHETHAKDLHLKAILVQKGREAANLLRTKRDIMGALRKVEEILGYQPDHPAALQLKEKLENLSLKMLPRPQKTAREHSSGKAREARYHGLLNEALLLIQEKRLDKAMEMLNEARSLNPNPKIRRIIENLSHTLAHAP